MKIIKNQPINAELQALIREFGNTLNVDSSLFLRKKDKTLENIDFIISRLEKNLLRLRKIEEKLLKDLN
jgi:hypothetical protein